jgi:23S rRNA maturation mini-RNase III
METEVAIRKLNIKMQAPYRILAGSKLNQIQASYNHYNIEAKRQSYILKNLNNKLKKEDEMIVKADKGKTECFPRNNKENCSKLHHVGCFIN